MFIFIVVSCQTFGLSSSGWQDTTINQTNIIITAHFLCDFYQFFFILLLLSLLFYFLLLLFFFSSIYGWIYGWMEPVGQEWLQQLKRVFCLLGKLQVTVPVISIAAKHQGRSGKMWCLWVDQSQLWYRLLQLCIYISGEMHVRIRCSYGGVQAPT